MTDQFFKILEVHKSNSSRILVKAIFDPCVKFLQNQPKTEENAMKILVLANLYKLEFVRQTCYYVIQNMRLQSILKASQDQDLDKESMQNILSRRIERLESFLNKVYPQFMGLVECCFWLWHESKQYMNWCPSHFSNGKSHSNIDDRIKKCTVCKEMLNTIIKGTSTVNFYSKRTDYKYGGSLYFDERLPHIIQEFSQLANH